MEKRLIMALMGACLLLTGCGTAEEEESNTSTTVSTTSSTTVASSAPQSSSTDTSVTSSTSTASSSTSTTTVEVPPTSKPIEVTGKDLPADAQPTVEVGAITKVGDTRCFTLTQEYDDMTIVALYKEGANGEALLHEVSINCGSYTLESIAKLIDGSTPADYTKEGDLYVRRNIDEGSPLSFDETYAMFSLAGLDNQSGELDFGEAEFYGPNGEKISFE